MSSVVVATDGSPACRRAADRAVALFPRSDLIVVTVVPCAFAPPDARGVRAVLDELEAARARDVVAAACRRLGPAARPVVLEGDPLTALCELARDEAAEAIVVGSLEGDSLRGALRGAVGAELPGRSPCPVIELGA